MPVSDDALAIMATIIMVAPPKPANARGTLKDYFRVARLLEDELFSPSSPADVAESPSPVIAPLRNYTPPLVAAEEQAYRGEGPHPQVTGNLVYDAEQAAPAPEEEGRIVRFTAKEREILLRGLTTLSGKLLDGDCIIPAEWRSARDKLGPRGAG